MNRYDVLRQYFGYGAFRAGQEPLIPLMKDQVTALCAGLARQERVPACMVFGNASLAAMAAKVLTSMEAFLAVSGVGQYKAGRYESAFLSEIQRYLKEYGES